MTIFLVRHAHAGKRSDWEDADAARPISDRGAAQATAIKELLVDRKVKAVLSSPSLRCTQTVRPLADELGLEVEADDRLAEGSATEDALELLLGFDGQRGVACTHGDLIERLLERLVEMGMEVDGPLLDQKGSVWTIHIEGGTPTRGRYTPPTG